MSLGSIPSFLKTPLEAPDNAAFFQPPLLPEDGLGGMGGLVPFFSFLVPDVEGLGVFFSFLMSEGPGLDDDRGWGFFLDDFFE